MKIEDFVDRMNSISVLINESDHENFSSDFLERMRNSYQIRANGKSSKFEGPILTLMFNYDCSTLEIGDISFAQTVTEDNCYYYFGSYGGDELVLNKSTREVELREYGTDHTLSMCGRNSMSFLNAIATAAEFLAHTSLSTDVSEDQARVCFVCEKCSKAAGGVRYASFYKTLLGCEH